MNDVPVVVDASVAVKWVIDEEHTDLARALLVDGARRPIFGPPHLASEVTNALYQQFRRGHISAEEAEEALDRFLALGVQVASPPGLYRQAFAFARTHALRSSYDAEYVVLARMVGADLWTDDRVLLRAVGPSAPWVRWIGDYEGKNV